MPDYILRPKLHGAGMINVFEAFRHLVPEFKDEILFRGFLIAFGRHVRLTLKRDDYDLVTHWWNGQTSCSDCMFLDSSRGGGREVFNEEGRLHLAQYLAEQTFVSLEQYFAAGVHAKFLKSATVHIEKDYLQKHLEEIQKGSLEEELLKVPKLTPKFALPKALVEANRAKNISETKLGKRPPEIQRIAPGEAMSSTQREALRWSRLSEDEKQAERDKKASRRKELRSKKVRFCELGIKWVEDIMNPRGGLETDTWVLVRMVLPLFSVVS
jgi:hypothetical protein